MPYKVFKSKHDKKWYFHVTGDNGEIIVPSQAYSRRDAAHRAVRDLETQILKDVAKRLEPTTPEGRAKQIEENQRKISNLPINERRSIDSD